MGGKRRFGRCEKVSFFPTDKLLRFAILLCCALLVPGVLCLAEEEVGAAQKLTLTLVKTYPHDPHSFCQGLIFAVTPDGTPFFYESSGLYGHSAIKKVSLDGKTLRSKDLTHRYFGEGATLFGDKIYQITWRENTCFVYDAATFRQVGKFAYAGEGWGLTDNGSELIMSDGSHRLTFRSPNNFKPTRQIEVFWFNPKTKERSLLSGLNELEWIDGKIWANIFGTTKIARIDPETGEVIQFFDFAHYVPDNCRKDPERVLNGIAWDKRSGHLFITGKKWPVLYEFAVENKPAAGESAQTAPLAEPP